MITFNPEPQSSINLTLATQLLSENINRVMTHINTKIRQVNELPLHNIEITINYRSLWQVIIRFYDEFMTINEFNANGFHAGKMEYYIVKFPDKEVKVTNIVAKYDGFTLKELYEAIPDTERCWLALRGIVL